MASEEGVEVGAGVGQPGTENQSRLQVVVVLIAVVIAARVLSGRANQMKALVAAVGYC